MKVVPKSMAITRSELDWKAPSENLGAQSGTISLLYFVDRSGYGEEGFLNWGEVGGDEIGDVGLRSTGGCLSAKLPGNSHSKIFSFSFPTLD